MLTAQITLSAVQLDWYLSSFHLCGKPEKDAVKTQIYLGGAPSLPNPPTTRPPTLCPNRNKTSNFVEGNKVGLGTAKWDWVQVWLTDGKRTHRLVEQDPAPGWLELALP